MEHRYSNEAPRANLSYIPIGASNFTHVIIDNLDYIEAAVREVSSQELLPLRLQVQR